MLQVDMVGAVQIVLHTLYLVCSDDVQQRTNADAMAYRAEEGLNQLALSLPEQRTLLEREILRGCSVPTS